LGKERNMGSTMKAAVLTEPRKIVFELQKIVTNIYDFAEIPAALENSIHDKQNAVKGVIKF
jgi:threonine dehydrogenase-like Zn-dependent dehydrogenase